MILKVNVIPLDQKEPQQQSVFFEGDIIIKTGVLVVEDIDKYMEEEADSSFFCPKMPEGHQAGTIHFDVHRPDGSTHSLVIAHCDAYLINDKGKTIDSFTCR